MEYNLFKNLVSIKKGHTDDISLNEQVKNELLDVSYIDSNLNITSKGLEALKPFKVKNAVILAAGLSSRFAPLSYEKPKGLLTVKGEVLIERQIRQLKEKGLMILL